MSEFPFLNFFLIECREWSELHEVVKTLTYNSQYELKDQKTVRQWQSLKTKEGTSKRRQIYREAAIHILHINFAPISGWCWNHACVGQTPAENKGTELRFELQPKRQSSLTELKKKNELFTRDKMEWENQNSLGEHNRNQSPHDITITMSKIQSNINNMIGKSDPFSKEEMAL